jgi:6-phosphofructokinase 1
MVIVIAEGAGQELLSESMQSRNQQDASGNKLLQDVGLWISQGIKVLNLTHTLPQTSYIIQ